MKRKRSVLSPTNESALALGWCPEPDPTLFRKFDHSPPAWRVSPSITPSEDVGSGLFVAYAEQMAAPCVGCRGDCSYGGGEVTTVLPTTSTGARVARQDLVTRSA